MGDVLVVEISGKRPGDCRKRCTEKLKIKYDHVIISNNSDGYITDWEIVNVPAEYENWYKKNIKTNDKSYYAPMNRSYAIQYAKENGYKYLVQLDDNIKTLKFAYTINEKIDDITFQKKYRVCSNPKTISDMMNDYIDCLVMMIQCTNAGISGCSICGAGAPGSQYLSERYCYSLFCLDVNRVSSLIYQGDFEDDIEFRLKLRQKGIPSIQCSVLMYSKVSQRQSNDTSGCRQAYNEAGTHRGDTMRRLYGNMYSCGITNMPNCCKGKRRKEQYFRHKLKQFKIGIRIIDKEKKKALDKKIQEMFEKYKALEDAEGITETGSDENE